MELPLRSAEVTLRIQKGAAKQKPVPAGTREQAEGTRDSQIHGRDSATGRVHLVPQSLCLEAQHRGFPNPVDGYAAAGRAALGKQHGAKKQESHWFQGGAQSGVAVTCVGLLFQATHLQKARAVAEGCSRHLINYSSRKPPLGEKCQIN